MKKKFLVITTVFIVFTFPLVNNYKNPKTNPLSSVNSFVKEKISKSLLENYLSSKGDAKQELEEKIKMLAIKDMGLDKWKEYSEYVKIIVYPVDILGDSKEELVIGLNLSKNLGAIGVYKLEAENYVLDSQIENLTRIEKISVKRNSRNNKRFLFVEEFLDERVGAYFTDRYLSVFTKIQDEFTEVYRESIDYEAYYYEKWSDPDKEKARWFKVNESNIIDYDSKLDENLNLTVNKNIRKAEGKNGSGSTLPTDFKEVEKKDYLIKYMWNEDYQRFIMGKGEMLSTGEKVGVLEDVSKTADYLLNLGDKCYKVINKNKKIKHIKHEELKISNP